MNSLKDKILKSQEVIRKAYKEFSKNKIVIAWTGGKDSTVLLHLIRSVFGNKVPSPVMFNDSTMEFEEIYEFIKKITALWGLDLIIIPHDQKELTIFDKTKNEKDRKKMSRLMKVNAINKFVDKYKIQAFLSGIRWDEHPSRSKELYFSPRENHMRIHPILHFTEQDIWSYIKYFSVPYVRLYDEGYRSLGEKPFTRKAEKGLGERSGREKDKENLMEKLRSLGYW